LINSHSKISKSTIRALFLDNFYMKYSKINKNPFLIVILIFIIYVSVIIIATWPVSVFSIEKSGTFGDSFGAINALFAGLGFAGLWTTLNIQQEQIKEQRNEILESKEKSESKDEKEIFFELLRAYRENFSMLKGDAGRSGIDAIKPMLDKAFDEYRKERFPVKPRTDFAMMHEAYAFQVAYKSVQPHDRIFSSARVLIELISSNKNGNYDFFKKIFNATLSVYEKEYVITCFLLKDIKSLGVVHKIFSSDVKSVYSASSRWRGALEYTISNGRVRKEKFKSIVISMRELLDETPEELRPKFIKILSSMESGIKKGDISELMRLIAEELTRSLTEKNDVKYGHYRSLLRIVRMRIGSPRVTRR